MDAKDTLKYAEVGRQAALKDCEEKGYNAVEQSFILEFWDGVIKACEKQTPKPPENKVHEKYPTLGKNYYCSCGVMFVDFERSGTNYCGNCGQKLREIEE